MVYDLDDQIPQSGQNLGERKWDQPSSETNIILDVDMPFRTYIANKNKDSFGFGVSNLSHRTQAIMAEAILLG